MADRLPYSVDKNQECDLHYSATGLADLGFSVFPLHTPTQDGCTCRKGEKCESAGKHPRTRSGFRESTTDPATIDAWWTKWPIANVGIRPGDGLVVIAIDG